MNVAYFAVLYLFLGSTPDGVDSWRTFTLGPLTQDECQLTLQSLEGDDIIAQGLSHSGALMSCMHDKTLADFIKTKGCKEERHIPMDHGVIERAYDCDLRGT